MSPSAEERPNFLKESNVDGAPMPFSKATDDSNENSHHLQQEGLHLHRVNVLLARQLEYYFSTANLAKDTYLSTLRSLNDGYVPVSIIANFGKVQALAPLDSAFAAVKIAATDFSDLLEVVVVNSDTGKRVLNHDEKPSKTVLAVGPVSGEPIPMNKFYSCALSDAESVSSQEKDEHVVTPATSKSLATSFSSASGRGSNGVQNTIILRETPDGMTEEVVRELFAFEGCPAIESLHLDLQNCWFVTLDTSSRDEMVDVMFKLRTKKFPTGESVKARLKSLAISSVSPSPVPVIPSHQPAVDPKMVMTMYAPQLLPGGQSQSNGNKKKQSSKSRKNKGKSTQQQSSGTNNGNKQNGHNKSNGGQSKRQQGKQDTLSQASASQSVTKAEEKEQLPPKLGEDDFPELLPADDTQTNKIEVEKVPDARSDADDDEFGKNRSGGFSDSSSTATTSTSSTPSPSQPSVATVMGGYAAAARKPAVTAPVQKTKPSESVKLNNNAKKAIFLGSGGKSSRNEKKQPIKTKKLEETREEHPPVKVQPPSWGGGRSFADILRQKNVAAISTSMQQAV